MRLCDSQQHCYTARAHVDLPSKNPPSFVVSEALVGNMKVEYGASHLQEVDR